MKPLTTTHMAAQPHSSRRHISKYKGVRKRSWGRWVAEIRVPHTRDRLWLGSYACPHQAARAYDVAAICLRGPSATLNLPFKTPPSPSATAVADLSPTSIRRLAAQEAEHFHHDLKEVQPIVGSDCSSAVKNRSPINPPSRQDNSSSHSFNRESSFHHPHTAEMTDEQSAAAPGYTLADPPSHHSQFSSTGVTHHDLDSLADGGNGLVAIAHKELSRNISHDHGVNGFFEGRAARAGVFNTELPRSSVQLKDLLIDEPCTTDDLLEGPSSLLDCWFSLDLSPTLSPELRGLLNRSLNKGLGSNTPNPSPNNNYS